MEEPKKQARKIFDGEQEKTFFSHPFIGTSSVNSWNQQIPKLLKRLDKCPDDRSLVILSALVVENQTDIVLHLLLPDYNKLLKKSNDFTFSTKLDLLSAFRIIPDHILLCANGVRLIRNEFGHNLELESLNDIKSGNKLVAYYENIPSMGKATGIKNKNLFETLTDTAAMGIRAYEYNIILFKEMVNSDIFLDELERRGKEKTDIAKNRALGNAKLGHGSIYTKKRH